MPSVQITSRSKFWIAALKVWKASRDEPGGGKWVWTQKTTGILTSESESVAMAMAEQLQHAAFAAAPDHVRPEGVQEISPEFYRKWIMKVCALAGVDSSAIDYRFSDVAEQWVQERDIAGSTEDRYRSHLRTFQGFLDRKGISFLADIDHGVLRAFYQEELATGHRPETAKAKLDTISMIFNRARDLGYIAGNPAKLVMTKRRGSQRAPKEPFSDAEVKQILEYFRCSVHARAPQWLFASLCGLYYGMRIGDATSLQEDNIVDGVLSFIPQKKRLSEHVVRLPLVPAVQEAMPVPVDGWYCPDLHGRPHVSQEYMRHLEWAGIEITRNKAGEKGKAVANKSFHSWRRTNTSLLANAGVDKRISMLIADHDDPKIHEHYTTFEIAKIAEALKVIGR